MNPILKKLQYKAQKPLLVMNAPGEFGEVIREVESDVHDKVSGEYGYIVLFVLTMAQLEKDLPKPAKALLGDGGFWICYPKGTSKKYKSDATRDTIREAVRKLGFEGVSMVAIDDNWSALRIRKAQYIKK